MSAPHRTEEEDAIILANKILDRINADPDDDLAMLARQFLRASARAEYWKSLAETCPKEGFFG
jgi:hypothetical protein